MKIEGTFRIGPSFLTTFCVKWGRRWSVRLAKRCLSGFERNPFGT